MSAFIFVLILVTLAQCRAQDGINFVPPNLAQPVALPLESRARQSAEMKKQFALTKSFVAGARGGVRSIDMSKLTPFYTVSSGIVPDNSNEAQSYICPGFRSVWGLYRSISGLCFSENDDGSGTFLKFMALTDDPAPAGFITVVAHQYRDLESCEKNGEIIETSSFETESSVCRGDSTEFYTNTPFPQVEASPLGVPTEVLREVPEDSKLFARYVSYYDGPTITCAPTFMYWFTTGECLKELYADTAFVYTFDNFQHYNENFYTTKDCTTQSIDGVSFLINQCLNYYQDIPGFGGQSTTFPKPIIFEGVSSESSESSEDSQNPPGQGLGAIIYGTNAEESGDTDGVSTTVKVVASVSACVVFVAAVALYFKGRYCVRKESQDTNLNLDDVAVVIA